ncbi:ankyrin repeat domain-containing protein [Treponema sp. OMZ 792]|uniref:ankyrin repeat domain-containing protein n=2 Tax=Treponema TaxID=157 RepID=UPI0020A3FEA9|nr:ankyrin repeat domain-containing protein [Treponema sp. OMZ 792]UTC74339.1 ankyrin repeat domain-containing protein [Treponema sp. OMZ 792]UTC80736.1 ankyrin repeat domain-containing protein [Treponema sp. OMZ 798]
MKYNTSKIIFILLCSFICLIIIFNPVTLYTVGWLSVKIIGSMGNSFNSADPSISVNIFKDTPAWDLAKAVNSQNIKKIDQICSEHKELINYREPLYGTPLLYWAIANSKYNSAEILLKNGADPDLMQRASNNTPLYLAVGKRWKDKSIDINENIKYTELLLKSGADPNIPYLEESYDEITVLMNAISTGDSKQLVELLINNGAYINTQRNASTTAASLALQLKRYTIAHYLIAECHADITKPCYDPVRDKNLYRPGQEKIYPVNILREQSWIFPLDSKEYKLKQDIIAEFKRQGVDYYATPIPDSTKYHIKYTYPDNYEEMLEKF